MEKIAIIGLACLFPGATTPTEYWQNLLDQAYLVSTATAEQMGQAADLFYHPEKGQADKYYSMQGGYVRGFQFDPHGYQLDPAVLTSLDNVFKWPLYVAREALRASGYLTKASDLARCGVILGNLSFPTQTSHRLFLPLYHRTAETALRELLGDAHFQLPNLPAWPQGDISLYNILTAGYPAAVIAQALGLGSAHLGLDAACASSLYSVKLACDYLLAHKADLMLAGAVSAADPIFINMGFSIFQAYPENGISRPLDKASSGLVASEGAGMFLLKRHRDAVRDGDKIYAVIHGVGLSNDGRGKHLLVPNPKGQYLAFERAYQQAEINPSLINYVECHATGTKLGDVTELNSMENFFKPYGGAAPMVGSAKSNLGHMLTAAGMANMIKVILGMGHDLIPPTVRVTDPLHSDGGFISKDKVVTTPQSWPQKTKYAGISAFGFGGTNAHLVLSHDHAAATPETTPPPPLPALAIVGMDAYFGQCHTLAEFKRAIYEGQPDFRPLPPERWKGLDRQTELLRQLGLAQAPEGAYIENFEMDFLHFRIPPNDTDQPDPQQLLIMKVADRALRDAGLDKQPQVKNVAVLIAMSTELSLHQFRGRVDITWQIKQELAQRNLTLPPDQITALENIVKDSLRPEAKVNQYISYIGNIMAARIAALWDFNGPAFTLSAEENSTWRALEVAQMMLAAGEVEAVLVGAVDLAGGLENVILRHHMAALHQGNPTLSLADSVQGWFVGEGAGAVVLKRADSISADKVYATIEALEFASRTLPVHPVTQACQQALATARLSPHEVGYLELHGSGIPLEDETEMQGIRAAYQIDPQQLPKPYHKLPPIALGSVKAIIGHTFAASGIASLIKTALCVQGQFLPATPNWSSPKPVIAWPTSPFYVPTESRPWLPPRALKGRVAAINSMSLDGSYAHVILREHPQTVQPPIASLTPYYLLPVVAATVDHLLSQLQQLETQLTPNQDLMQLTRQALASLESQTDQSYTISLVGRNLAELQREVQLARRNLPQAIAQQKEWRTPQGSYFTPKPLGRQGQVAFVYPGAFNGYLGMGKDLNQIVPGLYDQFGQLVSEVGLTLGEPYLFPRLLAQPSEADLKKINAQLMNESKAIMSAGTSYSILTTALVRDYLGLKPHAGIGYSLGEFTMFWAMGVWANGDDYNAKSQASPLFENRLAGPKNTVRAFWGLPPQDQATDDLWGSFVIKSPAPQVMAALSGEAKVYLTHINTSNEVVIAGDPTACQRVIQRGHFEATRAPFNDVLHCPPVRLEYQAFVDLNTLPTRQVKTTRFYSTSAYQPIAVTSPQIAASIATCLSEPVDFPRLIQQAYADGVRIFVELGPRTTCSRWINDILGGQDYLAVGINQRGVSDQVALTRMVAALVSHQVPLNVTALYAPYFNEISSMKAGVLKTVKLGGQAITDQILTDTQRQHFAPWRAQFASATPTRPINVNWWEQGLADDYGQIGYNAPLLPHDTDYTIKDNELMTSDNGSMPLDNDWYATQRTQLNEVMLQAQRNHAVFLKSRHQTLHQLQTLIQNQLNQLTQLAPSPDTTPQPQAAPPLEAAPPQRPAFPIRYHQPEKVIWDEADLLEFAGGDISKVFGEEFKIVDTYKRKVRLPLPPYLLVSRVTDLRAKVHEYKPSFIQTEYDIPVHAWYCTDGQAPSAVAVESGQCDLLLISYLGIDFENRDLRFYRLLDCTLTFLDDLPVEGQTLRYDISINSFARTAGPLLFFFSYNCYVGEKRVLEMRGGCAGFFTQAELDAGKGVIYTAQEIEDKKKVQKSYFEPLLHTAKRSFSEADIRQLCQGNIAACFGDSYNQQGLNPSLRLPPEAILMVDRVPSVDPQGGAWGLGLVIGEKIIEPDHWYFPCHFKDDEVLAGSLIAEGCVQLMQFYLLYLGFQTQTTDARFQPIRGLPQVVRCRGETTPCSDIMVYRLEVTELGLEPTPYAKANVEIHFQGRIVVDFKNLSLQLSEKPADDPYKLASERVREGANHQKQGTKALFNEDHIEQFAMGSIAACFGPEYAVYGERRIPRTPNGPLKLISRIVETHGTRLEFKAGSHLVSEYDVPRNAWYYGENNYPTMPYSILMEIALQPCGFLSAWLGSTLPYSDQDLYFRNLDGHGTIIAPNGQLPVGGIMGRERGKTITNRVELLSSVALQGIIIQKFNFELSCDGQVFYQGFASFGYFTHGSLKNQVGLDGGKDIRPWYESQTQPQLTSLAATSLTQAKPQQPHYRLAGQSFSFLDELRIMPQGGQYGLGYVYAQKRINPADWFYKAHFHQDPVMPGSLGVEAILQALQAYAIQQNLGQGFKSPYFEHAVNHKIVWKYRGQIIQRNELMYLELHLKRIDRLADQIMLVADASLWRDNMRIYEVTDIALAIREATNPHAQ